MTVRTDISAAVEHWGEEGQRSKALLDSEDHVSCVAL